MCMVLRLGIDLENDLDQRGWIGVANRARYIAENDEERRVGNDRATEHVDNSRICCLDGRLGGSA